MILLKIFQNGEKVKRSGTPGVTVTAAVKSGPFRERSKTVFQNIFPLLQDQTETGSVVFAPHKFQQIKGKIQRAL